MNNRTQLLKALKYSKKMENSICVTKILDHYYLPTYEDSREQHQEKKHFSPEQLEKPLKGIRTHSFVYIILNNKRSSPRNNYDRAFMKWWEKNKDNYITVGTNIRVCSKKYPLHGEIDVILYHINTSEFTILEVKTNDERRFTKCDGYFNPPYDDIEKSTLNKAKLQVTFYREMLHEYTKRKIEAKILWLKQNGKYEEITVSKNYQRMKQAVNNL